RGQARARSRHDHGMRGLCNGLGPAMFGLIFNLFHVDLNEKGGHNGGSPNASSTIHTDPLDDSAVTTSYLGRPLSLGHSSSFWHSCQHHSHRSSSYSNNGTSASILMASGPLTSRRLSDKADGIYKKSDDDEEDGLDLGDDREYTTPLMRAPPMDKTSTTVVAVICEKEETLFMDPRDEIKFIDDEETNNNIGGGGGAEDKI
ncbi:Uncharacterized protein FKW44_010780, partial [Caligus rogercresseyi]